MNNHEIRSSECTSQKSTEHSVHCPLHVLGHKWVSTCVLCDCVCIRIDVYAEAFYKRLCKLCVGTQKLRVYSHSQHVSQRQTTHTLFVGIPNRSHNLLYLL